MVPHGTSWTLANAWSWDPSVRGSNQIWMLWVVAMYSLVSRQIVKTRLVGGLEHFLQYFSIDWEEYSQLTHIFLCWLKPPTSRSYAFCRDLTCQVLGVWLNDVSQPGSKISCAEVDWTMWRGIEIYRKIMYCNPPNDRKTTYPFLRMVNCTFSVFFWVLNILYRASPDPALRWSSWLWTIAWAS